MILHLTVFQSDALYEALPAALTLTLTIYVPFFSPFLTFTFPVFAATRKYFFAFELFVPFFVLHFALAFDGELHHLGDLESLILLPQLAVFDDSFLRLDLHRVSGFHYLERQRLFACVTIYQFYCRFRCTDIRVGGVAYCVVSSCDKALAFGVFDCHRRLDRLARVSKLSLSKSDRRDRQYALVYLLAADRTYEIR